MDRFINGQGVIIVSENKRRRPNNEAGVGPALIEGNISKTECGASSGVQTRHQS